MGDEEAEAAPRPLFLVVEGNNGTGKSSVAAHLAGRLGAVLFHFPPEFVRFREAAGLDERIRPVPRLLYYLAATAHLSDLVVEGLRTGPVVCDRYLVAPVSLLLAEQEMSADQVLRMAAPVEERILRPDLLLLLRADHAVAVERVRARSERERSGALTVVERRMADPGFSRRREDALREHSRRLCPVAELDTTELSVEAMTALAWAAIATVGAEAAEARREGRRPDW